MTLVLNIVGLLVHGSLAGPVSAATGDHQALSLMNADDDHSHSGITTINCSTKVDGASRDMGNGACCVGTCTTILGMQMVAIVSVGCIHETAPSDHPVSMRSGTVEFLRPPSMTV